MNSDPFFSSTNPMSLTIPDEFLETAKISEGELKLEITIILIKRKN
ncbi:hypothetical protein cce_5248 (plasmid) [Crocosphaera subtropica ATCC 51142]|uniref:Uncharacterized protein n=1 Tax=Crocosphaera subtropica (strain ATCC 51142 / BH68) TaxID=43989 RepID=B1X383_CROS5|nr:hypothetical protein cce_5248 [Crocosphaera subtropica ATCC 51142]